MEAKADAESMPPKTRAESIDLHKIAAIARLKSSGVWPEFTALNRFLDALRRVLAIQAGEDSAIFPDTAAGEAKAREWAERTELDIRRRLYELDSARMALLESGFDVPDKWLIPKTGIEHDVMVYDRPARGNRRWYIQWGGIPDEHRKALGQIWQEVSAAVMRLNNAAPTPAAPKPPPTRKQRAVLNLLLALPGGEALTGETILDALSRGNPPMIMDMSTLTRHIMPVLKKDYGVKNRPRVGYYISP